MRVSWRLKIHSIIFNKDTGMEQVDDLPLEAEPPIELVHWNNDRARENDFDEQLHQFFHQERNELVEQPPPVVAPAPFQLRIPRPLNKLMAIVEVRNGTKYFHTQKHNLWFTYLSDTMIGEQIDEPIQKKRVLSTIYRLSNPLSMVLVIVNDTLYYMSNDRKFYTYETSKFARLVEVPEPYVRWEIGVEIGAEKNMVERKVCMNGKDKIVDVFPKSLLFAFEDYKDDVVLDWPTYPYLFEDQLPINITHLNADNGGFTELPPLPASLKSLKCGRNKLTELPELPPNLKILYCDHNQLTGLPVLPAGLKELNIAYNQVPGLAAWPAGLEKFTGDYNPLKFLPALPTGLFTLSCKRTQIKCVPKLPETLGYLDCSHNHLGELPTLPEGLDTLWCHNCHLTTLPEIPESLTRLDYSHNRIRGIVDFPYWVQYYKCSYNFIEGFDLLRYDTGCSCCDEIMKKRDLDALVPAPHKHHPFNFKSPRELMRLDCSHNPIKTFPEFPDELRKLNCSHTRIVSLPDLPTYLYHLDCSYTPLKALPALPRHMSHLDCSSTLIRTLPELEVLPFRFGSLSCYNTRLDPALMRYIDQGDLDSVNYYTFAQRHKERLKKDVRPVLNLWIALGCERNSEYMETNHGVLPAEIIRRVAMFLSHAVNKQPVEGVWSLAAIVAGFRAHVLEPIVRPENIV